MCSGSKKIYVAEKAVLTIKEQGCLNRVSSGNIKEANLDPKY